MASSTLNNLPAEILLLIAERLDTASLRELALVDKRGHAAASNVLFRTITVAATILETRIEIWSAILQRHSLWRSVQHLRVNEDLRPSRFILFPKRRAIDFSPVLELASRLPALTKVTWACPAQPLPQKFLHFLEQRLPSCQLNLYVDICPTTSEIYDRRLTSSPSLHAIYYTMEYAQHRQVEKEKILQHIVALAPNLRILRQVATDMNPVGRPPSNIVSPESWSHLPPKQASLAHMDYPSPLNMTTLAYWTAATDWSRLRELSMCTSWLRPMSGMPDEHVFNHLRTKIAFPSLEKLALEIPTAENVLDEAAVASAARRFICTLPPLSVLLLSGYMDYALLAPVLKLHGMKLRILDLSPLIGGIDHGVYFNHVTSDVESLSASLSHCQRLEELTITVPRTCGDRREVAVYRAIGSLPRLQQVNITLDARHPDFFSNIAIDESEAPADMDFDAWDNEVLDDWFTIYPESGPGPRKGHVRKLFINTAIDSTLAESIFRAMASAKPTGSFPLEEARFTIIEDSHDMSLGWATGFGGVSSIISKNWTVKRSQKDDQRDLLISVPWSDKRSGYSTWHHRSLVTQYWSTIKAPFRKLWPSPRQGYDGPEGWENDWKSFPLDT